MNAVQFFKTYFPKLAGVDAPYKWQTKLFEAFTAGDWPSSIGLPTGSGKTGLMEVWLLAFAWSRIASTNSCIPRRLVWVVNRRVVVDQATNEADRIVAEIEKLPLADPLRAALQGCSPGGDFLAVSTLRGQKADNRAWSRDPTCPAIIIGTVDMIGSRLLFRGYGDGRYWRPLHAGLLGVDALIVNDEAHLTPAFATLLLDIERLPRANRIGSKSLHVLLLSATSAATAAKPFAHSLEEDLAIEGFRRIYTAEKRLYVHWAADEKAVAAKLFSRAVTPGPARTILFIEQPEKAAELAERLRAATGSTQIALLTGTMRGWERDKLTKDPVFAAFTGAVPPSEPAWLVSTSAGEVGVNITCERMITGLVTSDHLIQRFGRLNRFPGKEHETVGEAHLICVPPPEPKEDDEAVPRTTATLRYLRSLPTLPNGSYDISCRSLYQNEPPREARSAPPVLARFESRLIDLWSQTTASGPMIPAVAPWLHGKQDAEAPETEVAWREDVKWLVGEDVSSDDREKVLQRYPVLPQERLSEPSSRVREKLLRIAEGQPGERALVVAQDGSVEAGTIGEIARGDLAYALLLLPPGCGGLHRGMFRADSAASDQVQYDVADAGGQPRQRFLAARLEGGLWRLQRLGLNAVDPEPLHLASLDRDTVTKFAAERSLARPLKIAVSDRTEEESDTESRCLLYFTAKPRARAAFEVPLDEHLSAVARKASEWVRALELQELEPAFRLAGQCHDSGKASPLWQQAMGGSVERPLAKTKMAVAPALLAGYRHELGSVLEATTGDTEREQQNNDLAWHLIASHHGWARPYFEVKAYDRRRLRRSQTVALEAVGRFGELQTAWGAWGLAYLEAVFKAADGLVSEAQEGVENV